MHSSTSIDIKFRKSMALGFIRVSPSEIVGNSSGRPPASNTPRLTDSASARKWRLQLTSSDHELQMPITGRPTSALREMPSAWIDARWMKPARSAPPNQRALRRVTNAPPFLRGAGQLPTQQRRHAVDDDVLHPLREYVRLEHGAAVREACGIEGDDVCARTFPQDPAITEPDSLCRLPGEPMDRILRRQQLLVTHHEPPKP